MGLRWGFEKFGWVDLMFSLAWLVEKGRYVMVSWGAGGGRDEWGGRV